jgi:hypothetical protein
VRSTELKLFILRTAIAVNGMEEEELLLVTHFGACRELAFSQPTYQIPF